jgi:predicted transcriptional regulator
MRNYNAKKGGAAKREIVCQFVLSSFRLGGRLIKVGRRRGEVQITMDVLAVCLNGVRVTHLMYRANLSYSTLRKYLSAMSKQGLIGRTIDSNGSRVYHATEKGRALLAELRNVKNYLTIDAGT